MSPAVILLGIPIAFALAQLALAHRRDLGVSTLGSCGCVLLLDPSAVPVVIAAVAIGALAWLRGARHGVGRPALTGIGVAVLVTGFAAPQGLAAFLPGAGAAALGVLALPLAGVTAVGGLLALERPGPRPHRIRWYRTVSIKTNGDAPPSSTAPPTP